MRELKFRAWDKNYQRMTPVDIIRYFDNTLVAIGNYSGFWDAINPEENYVLMQYTGTRDMNGEEVWEGDFVKWSNDLMLVEWLQYGFQLRHIVSRAVPGKVTIGWLPLAPELSNRITVVGNLYENKDLRPILLIADDGEKQ